MCRALKVAHPEVNQTYTSVNRHLVCLSLDGLSIRWSGEPFPFDSVSLDLHRTGSVSFLLKEALGQVSLEREEEKEATEKVTRCKPTSRRSTTRCLLKTASSKLFHRSLF